MPSVTIRTARRTFCCGHPFTRLMSDRYGLSMVETAPRGRRTALTARSWSGVKF